MAEIKNITDKEGEVVYPVTKINAVYTQDNKRLDNVMLTVGDSVGSTDAVINAQTLDGKTLDEVRQVEYSTEEKVIGKWGNKSLYRKAIEYNTSIGASQNQVIATITNVDKIIDFSLNALVGTYYINTLPMVNMGNLALQALPSLNKQNGQLVISTGSQRTLDSVYGYVTYTKTTD